MQPWVDATDLQEIRQYEEADEDKMCTLYQWRDSSIRVLIRDEDNEIIDIWQE